MIKRVKRYGNNLVIVFTAEEERLFGLQEGDTITIDDMLWEKKINNRKHKEVKK